VGVHYLENEEAVIDASQREAMVLLSQSIGTLRRATGTPLDASTSFDDISRVASLCSAIG
jgi:hypothetical protein